MKNLIIISDSGNYVMYVNHNDFLKDELWVGKLLFLDEISAASLKLKPGGPTQASGPVFNFAVISIRD